MTNKIKVESCECDGTILMYVDVPIFKEKKDTMFEIQNKVKLDTPIEIKFYEILEKGETGMEIPGFCTEMGADTVLTIAKNDKADCTPPSSFAGKYFAYTVENATAMPLDPVIIIEDELGADGNGDGGLIFGLSALVIAGVGGLIIGAFLWNLIKGRSQAAS